MLVEPPDGVEDGDVLALGVGVALRYAHPAVLDQELGSGVRHRLLVQLQDLGVFPKAVVAVDAEPHRRSISPFKVLRASATVDRLKDRPLRVALGAEQTVDLLDLDNYVDARIDRRAAEDTR